MPLNWKPQVKDWDYYVSPDPYNNVSAQTVKQLIGGLQAIGFPIPRRVCIKGSYVAQPMAAPLVDLDEALENGLPSDLPVYIVFYLARNQRVAAQYVKKFVSDLEQGLQFFYATIKREFNYQLSFKEYLFNLNQIQIYQTLNERFEEGLNSPEESLGITNELGINTQGLVTDESDV